MQEKIFKRRETEKTSASRALDLINEKINFQAEEIEKLADVLALDEAEKIFESAKNALAQFKDFDKRVADGEKYVEKNQRDLDAAQKKLSTASNKAATLRGIVKTLQSQISEKYRENPKKIFADLKKNIDLKNFFDAAWEKAEKEFHKLDRQKSNQEGKIKTAENSKTDAEKKIAGKVKPDLAALEKTAGEKRNLYEKAVSETAVAEQNLNLLNRIFAELNKLGEKIQTATNDFEIWEKLSAVANGKNPAKMTFQAFYLNAMFQNVIYEANERLEKMRQKSGLDLDIFDDNTGRARPVETLSGGESFIASLSLALGLAEVVQNIAGGINLDTIFIDEGFGSLDGETLDFAMNTLTDLQKSGNKLIGIISHVEDLRQRIPARLEVTKTKAGSTAKFV